MKQDWKQVQASCQRKQLKAMTTVIHRPCNGIEVTTEKDKQYDCPNGFDCKEGNCWIVTDIV